jgi:hypothetical protein
MEFQLEAGKATIAAVKRTKIEENKNYHEIYY